MSFRRLLYSLLLYLIFPFVIFRLFWRSRSNPAYRQRIFERMGFVNIESDKPIIWLHAVSVGETVAAQPLIESLILQYPNHKILVTTTTPTGSDRVNALFGDRVAHVYFPYDLPDVVSRFIKRVKPQLLIVIETEIWPNLYAACHKNNIPLALVNARLSQRSADKYLKIKSLVAETLTNINFIAVRSFADKERFKALGASDDQLSIVGNIKFDFEVSKKQVEQGRQWRKQLQHNKQVWVVASTHAGEDEKILAFYKSLQKQFPTLLLVLIPRHPERFDDVFQLCMTLDNDNIKTVRHSQTNDYQNIQTNIILGDSMGEMESWFATADVVFMGGSLVEVGGHNPLEAIAQGVPVVSGPHMFNFDDIAGQLSEEGLLFVCESDKKIEETITKLLEQQTDLAIFEMKAKAFMQQHRGVTARLIRLLIDIF
ncbi:MAG: lipid IV(A) 3-deoxy-D-manno-octulosonic acid transferase [Cocleimonas sp.]|nr:lipid IV(A) 3-deoxy-D-manno-octulosonic acid transferase [Cocleimonas sp.]